jgi:hypothetical protein
MITVDEKVLQQALKALWTAATPQAEEAITALKAALEQPARPLCKGIPRRGCNYLNPCDTVCNKCGEIHHHHQMVAQFQAAQQPEQPQEATHLRDLLKRIRQWDALDIPDSDGAYWKREIDAALEQPEQPEQEPFGYIWPTGRHPEFRYTQQMRDGVAGMPLYTHPPRREWRGLTEEEFGYIYVRSATHEEFARAVEQALKEKNHG